MLELIAFTSPEAIHLAAKGLARVTLTDAGFDVTAATVDVSSRASEGAARHRRSNTLMDLTRRYLMPLAVRPDHKD